jgi:hypothetical protein
MSYEGSIWDGIENGHIYGEEETVGDEVFFKNLSLTKSGKAMLRFSKLTIKDIDNSYGNKSIKEWLVKPLVLESCKYILLAVLAFLGGVYSSEIKSFFTSFVN